MPHPHVQHSPSGPEVQNAEGTICGICGQEVDNEEEYITGSCSSCGSTPYHTECAIEYLHDKFKAFSAREKNLKIHAKKRTAACFQLYADKCPSGLYKGGGVPTCPGRIVGAETVKPTKAAPAPPPPMPPRPAARGTAAQPPQQKQPPRPSLGATRKAPKTATHNLPGMSASCGALSGGGAGGPGIAPGRDRLGVPLLQAGKKKGQQQEEEILIPGLVDESKGKKAKHKAKEEAAQQLPEGSKPVSRQASGLSHLASGLSSQNLDLSSSAGHSEGEEDDSSGDGWQVVGGHGHSHSRSGSAPALGQERRQRQQSARQLQQREGQGEGGFAAQQPAAPEGFGGAMGAHAVDSPPAWPGDDSASGFGFGSSSAAGSGGAAAGGDGKGDVWAHLLAAARAGFPEPSSKASASAPASSLPSSGSATPTPTPSAPQVPPATAVVAPAQHEAFSGAGWEGYGAAAGSIAVAPTSVPANDAHQAFTHTHQAAYTQAAAPYQAAPPPVFAPPALPFSAPPAVTAPPAATPAYQTFSGSDWQAAPAASLPPPPPLSAPLTAAPAPGDFNQGYQAGLQAALAQLGLATAPAESVDWGAVLSGSGGAAAAGAGLSASAVPPAASAQHAQQGWQAWGGEQQLQPQQQGYGYGQGQEQAGAASGEGDVQLEDMLALLCN